MKVPRVLMVLPLAFCLRPCSPAHAQVPAEHRVTVSGGVVWSGGYGIGDAAATLRTNAPGAEPPPFAWFNTQSSIEPAVGAAGRLEVALTRSLSIDAGASYSTPTLGTTVSGDTEAATVALEGEALQQYVVDVGATWQLPVTLGPRIRPFASGGAGYLRQLHEARTSVETGQVYSAGGGVRVWLRGLSAGQRAMGLRADVRATWRRKGIDFENATRVFPTVTMMIFVGL